MALTAAKVSASSNRLIYLLTGDGAASSATIASLTLLADAVDGPLKDFLNDTYANQAAMRAVFGGGSVEMSIHARLATDANIGSLGVDVDVDAVTATKPEINVAGDVPALNDTAYLVLEHKHSIVQ